MLRSICIPVKTVFHLSTITSGFCTKAAPTRRLFNEVNTVKMVGTLISDSHQLPSGTKQLTVKIYDSDDKYSNHTVRTNTKTNYTAGQRVFIQGKLRSNKYQLSDEKSITTTIVKGEKVIPLENDCGGEADANSVDIVANISSDVKMRENDCTFNVATNFLAKNETGENIEKVNFHHVAAYDFGVRQYIENNLSKSDRVLISGRIGHMTHTKEDGSKAYSGFIVAESISKLRRREKSLDESTESGKIKEEN